jgi:hypothetical protein
MICPDFMLLMWLLIVDPTGLPAVAEMKAMMRPELVGPQATSSLFFWLRNAW